MELPKEALDQLLEDLKTAKSYEDLMGKDGAIKKLMKQALEQLLEAELGIHLGYQKHSPEPKAHSNRRNGTSSKTVTSDLGPLTLDLPRDREGTFEPVAIKKHERALGQLQNAVISMYAKGMSTRDIQAHMEQIYGLELSPSAISLITDQVHSLVRQWQQRPLEELYPIVFLDALFFKVRQEGRIMTKACYSCLAIDLQGHKELLGLWISEEGQSPAEGAAFWLQVLSELRERGLKDILLACVDGLKGFPEAIGAIYPQTAVQQCVVHQIRSSMRYVSWKHQKEFLRDLKQVYDAPTEPAALDQLKELEEKWHSKYPLALKGWRTNWTHLATYFQYPEEIRRMIYTTNSVEALHRQLRKVTRPKTIFPDADSLLKMLYLAYDDMRRKWTMPVHNWSMIISQLSILYPDRIKPYV